MCLFSNLKKLSLSKNKIIENHWNIWNILWANMKNTCAVQMCYVSRI
jgi:hypothetical protein